MAEKQFQIHNTTRDPLTRLVRAQSPQHSKMTLLIGGGSLRVLRHRPVVVYESIIRRLLPELLQKQSVGVLKVTTMQGERVDLSTLKPLEKLAAAPPLPHPPVDSAALDKQNTGIKMTKYGDPKATPRGPDIPLPKVGETAIPEGAAFEEEELTVQSKEVVPKLVEQAQPAEELEAVEEPEEESFGTDMSGAGGKKSRRRRK